MTRALALFDSLPSRMSDYDRQTWDQLERYWARHSNRRGLPNWASKTLDRTGEFAGDIGARVAKATPRALADPMKKAGEAMGEHALQPAIKAATALLELVNDWALEMNDPKAVERIARKRGLDIETFRDLQAEELRTLDRLLAANTLKWRTTGAVEGGAMGLLAMVPVAGIPAAITADILVIQVLSTSIAARMAHSYGYDAKDPEEQVFIQRLVQRSFMAQAAKAAPLRDTARAAEALAGRVRWSEKLRADHRLVAALEKLLKQLGPAGARVPVQNVAKVVPFIGVVIGAGVNATVLGNVAADAKRYCQTRFLCETYNLPLPSALRADSEEHRQTPKEN